MSRRRFVLLLTKKQQFPDAVKEALDTQNFEECWPVHNDSYSSDDRTFLLQQVAEVGKDFEHWRVYRGKDCLPTCINPWHAQVLELSNQIKGLAPTEGIEMEWPEFEDRIGVMRGIVHGQVTGLTKWITLEEFYDGYATVEELRQRGSKRIYRRPTRRKRGDTPRPK